MSGGKLVVRQALGLTGNVKNCLTFVEEHQLAYVCGHQVVIINTETKEQNFISGTATYQHQSLGVTAIASCLSKKVIGVAEKVESSAIVTFYDSHTLRKKKLLTYPELGSSEIRCLAFSEDGRYLLTQGASPEWNLVLWNVDKAIKILCSTKISVSDENAVNQVSFCPWDPTVILVIGRSLLRFFRFIEGTLRPISFTIRRDSANFISHAWLNDEYLIVGTEHGEIILIENFEIRGHITTSRFDQEELSPILCLHKTSRGFIMGSSGSELKIFEKKEDIKEKFQLEDTYIIPGNYGNILEITLGLDELLVCGMEKHQLLACSLSSLHSLKDGGSGGGSNTNQATSQNAQTAAEGKGEGLNSIFESVLTPFHFPNNRGDCEITGIDVALWKQIVVTCAKDRTLRVWNLNDKRIEIMKEFEDEPIGLSVHPTGIYVIVAFSDKVRLFSLLLEEIYLCREIAARQISYVKFSRGGQYFAVSIGTNLQIYQTYTGIQMVTLRGHNNRIRSVLWLNFDSRVVTFGAEGIIHVWDLFPLSKRPESYTGTVPFQCGTGPLDGTMVYSALNDRQLKEFSFLRQENNASGNNPSGATTATGGGGSGNNNALETVLRCTKSVDLNYLVSNMLFDEARRLLIMGTISDGPCGIAVTMTSPSLGGGSVGSNAPPLIDLHLISSGTITALCQSYDGNSIYSADSQGCIYVSEFESASSSAALAASKSPGKPREGIVAFEFNEEVVIHKQDLQNRKQQIYSLTQAVEELNKSNEHQLRLKDMEHKDKLKEIVDSFHLQLTAEKLKYDELEQEKVTIEKDFNKKVKLLEEKQIEELQLLEKKYKNKYNAEENRHKLLMEETFEAHKKWNEENEMLIISHQKYLQEVTEDFEYKITLEQRQQKDLQKEKEELNVNYDTMKNETETDGDREVAEMKIRYDAKLKQEEETAQQLMTQHAAMSKNYETLMKESSQQKIEIKRLKDKEARLYETIHTLEKDIQSHKKEIREREETITDKEKRIFDLKKKNQELEKFRFVLDYKIKELKLQIAPREHEIATMKKQIEEMNIELEQYQKSNLALNLMIDELKLKIDGIKSEYTLQEERCLISNRFLEKFCADLQELWLCKQDIHLFKQKVIKMYRIYVQEEINQQMNPSRDVGEKKSSSAKAKKGSLGADLEDPQQLYNRDREQMERSLDSLRRAMKTEMMAHKRDLSKMMRESVLLTKELNTLRKNARSLLLQKKAIEQASPELTTFENIYELMELLGLSVKKPVQQQKGEKDQSKHLYLAPSPPTGTTAGGLDLLKPPKRSTASQGRSTALRTTSADGQTVHRANDHSDWVDPQTITANGGNSPSRTQSRQKHNQSRQDQWEAWREIQIQYDQMKVLEDTLNSLCESVGLDPIPILVAVDNQVDAEL